MKRLLRAMRAWTLRPASQALDALLETQRDVNRELRAQGAVISDLVRGTAIPYLEQISSMLDQQQLSFEETLTQIREQKLSFARFGDGEFKLMLRPQYRLRFQSPSKELADALLDVFVQQQHQHKRLLLGFPTLYRDLHWSRVWIDIWPEVRELVPKGVILGNSHVSRPICFQELGPRGVSLWRSIWQSRNIVVITGRDSRMTLIPELFDNVTSIEKVDSESIDAFRDLDRLSNELEQFMGKERLFLIALGPTGTILASKLANRDEQAIDIGHISDSYQTVFKGDAWPESKPITRIE